MDGVINVTRLLNDLSAWMFGLAPIAGGLAVAYHLTARHLSADEHQAAAHTRNVRSAVIGTMIALGASALIRWLSGYVAA